jgi:hypothetical protein
LNISIGSIENLIGLDEEVIGHAAEVSVRIAAPLVNGDVTATNLWIEA